MEKYQVMPELSPEAYEALKADIKERGVLVPLEFCIEGDDTLVLLDGHHRLRICTELGITDYPKLVRANLGSDDDKRAYARQINLLRRHLTTEQRRSIIKFQLKDTPELSDNAIASMLGVSDKTVTTQRKELESTSEIPKLDKRTGKDGKIRPSVIHKPVSVFNPNEKQIRLLGDDAVVQRMADNKSKSPVVASQQIKREELSTRKGKNYQVSPDDVKFIHADLCNGLPEIADNSVDLIFCKPRYSDDSPNLFISIAEIAERTLTLNGSLLVMCGCSDLPVAMRDLCSVAGMRYWWTLCFVTERKPTLLQDKRLSSFWKPIIHLVKGEYVGDVYSDFVKVPFKDGNKGYIDSEATFHSIKDVIYAFTNSGGFVADFCMGDGSTGIACVELGRKFVGVETDKDMFNIARRRILGDMWNK